MNKLYNLLLLWDRVKSYLVFLPIFVLLFSIIPSAYSYILPKTTLQLYQESDVIVLGMVVSAEPFINSDGLDQTKYTIQILQPIKSNLQKDTIDVIGLGSIDAKRHLSDETIFLVDQKVFLLLVDVDDTLYVSPRSVSAENYDPNKYFILPPLQLAKAGIPIDEINCKDGLKLVIKANNGSPACVKYESVDPLISRGWATEI